MDINIITTIILLHLCVINCCPGKGTDECCYNQYRRENDCINCEPGTFGDNCEEKCPYGLCGLFCSMECSCDQRFQICDIAKCCVNVTSILCQSDIEQITLLASQQSVTSSTLESHPSAQQRAQRSWSNAVDGTSKFTDEHKPFFKMDTFCLILVSFGIFVIILLLITVAYFYRNIKRLKCTLRDTNMQLIKCQMENDINKLKTTQEAQIYKEEKTYLEIGEVNILSAPNSEDPSGYLSMEAVPIGARYVEMNKWQSVENMIN